MNTFSFLHLIKRSLLGLFMVGFLFTATYVPQSHTPRAEAIFALEWTQVANFFESIWTGITTTSILGASLESVAFDTANWSVTNTLNGLAWAAAKAAISAIQRSIVRWINSGFQGSPAFIQDLGGFITNIADETMGSFIQQIGGPLSMVCSPFRLNVQIALSSAYSQSRNVNSRRCTLTGALQNIQNFIGGDMSQGGWESWFRISQNPSSYTPYGSSLNASMEAGISIRSAQGQQVNILNWGSGFMSSKVCNTVEGATGPTQQCSISTPGNVIERQLNDALGLGHDSLVAADQINEIIGALMQQLVSQVLTGAGGLLGAGGATGNNAQYTDPNFNVNSYAPGMEAQGTANGREMISNSIALENQLLAVAQDVVRRYEAGGPTDPRLQGQADAAYNEARAIQPQLQAAIAQLETLLAQYDATSEAGRVQMLSTYASLATTLNTASSVAATSNRWYSAINGIAVPADPGPNANNNGNTAGNTTGNSTGNTTGNSTPINTALANERNYLAAARAVITAYENVTGPTAAQQAAYQQALATIPTIQGNITDIEDAAATYDGATTPGGRTTVLSNFNAAIAPDLHTAAEISTARTLWGSLFGIQP